MKALTRFSPRMKAFIHRWLIENWLLTAMFLGYVIVLSTATLIRHYSFQTSAWDLGIFDQALHNTLSGRLFYYTAELYANPSGSIFGVHFSPILFIVLPFYAILQSPMTLLVIQSVALGSGAYPVFLITQNVLKDRKLAYYFSLLYLVYPHVYGINIFDFHPDAFFVPFTMFALYYFAKGSWKPYFIFLLLGLSTKELMAVIFATFGVAELFIQRHEVVNVLRSRNHASEKLAMTLGTILIAACWYLIANQIIRVFNPTPPQGFTQGSPWSTLGLTPLNPLTWFQTGQVNLVQAITYDFQSKLYYVFTVFTPLGFLSLFQLLPMLPALLWIALAFLSNYPPYYQIGFQYSALITPFVVFAAIKGFVRIQSLFKTEPKRTGKLFRRLFLACVLVSLVLTVQSVPTSLQIMFTSHDQKLNNLLAQLQQNFPSASILTQYDLFPHLSTNLKAYVIPPPFPAFNKSYYSEYVKSLFDLRPDLIIFDINPDIRTDAHRQTFLYGFENLEKLSSEYGLYACFDGAFVYRHNYPGELTLYEPFTMTLKYAVHLDTTTVLFSSVFPRGTYQVTYQMNLPDLGTKPACTAQLSQGQSVLATEDLYGGQNSRAISFQSYTLTMNVTSSSSEIAFSVVNPTTSADVYLKTIVVSLQSLP